MQDPRALRRHLDDHYRIASGRDLELRAADVWAGRGAAVALLARLTQQAGADAVAARLAALAGTTEWAVRELLEPRAGRPPQLLWAGDVRQVVGLARLGYAAGYLDAERAWALIERAGSVAFALFDTYDEFHANARLWTAWVEDGLDDVQRYDDRVAALRRSGWPAASVDFPADRDVVLPSAVTDPWSVAGDVHSAEG